MCSLVIRVPGDPGVLWALRSSAWGYCYRLPQHSMGTDGQVSLVSLQRGVLNLFQPFPGDSSTLKSPMPSACCVFSVLGIKLPFVDIRKQCENRLLAGNFCTF